MVIFHSYVSLPEGRGYQLVDDNQMVDLQLSIPISRDAIHTRNGLIRGVGGFFT